MIGLSGDSRLSPSKLDSPQLVIFDCDGVLVDSEPIAHEVLSEVLADIGLSMTPAQVWGKFFGKTVPQCLNIIEEIHGEALPEHFFDEWRKHLYATLRERPVEAVAGVKQMLASLELPRCVVSNGPVAKMETTLGVTGLLSYFDGALYSPDSGLPGKPAPDLFCAAAAAFGADPRRCVVIEDSPNGIRGALAAGMRALGFTGLPHANAAELRAAGAEALFDDMRRLSSLLAC